MKQSKNQESLDSRKDSQPTKFEQRSQIFVKLSFRELCDSKLSSLHAFDNYDHNSLRFNRLKKER